MPENNRPSPAVSRPGAAFAALRELGIRPLAFLAAYRLALRSGYLRRMLNSVLAERLIAGTAAAYIPLWELPTTADLKSSLSYDAETQVLEAAKRVVAGRVLLFGALDTPLILTPTEPLPNFDSYEDNVASGDAPEQDIRCVWEAGRFGWAYLLGRAYRLSGDERYAQAFWLRFEQFSDANPPYRGPHWASGQEAALRLIALSFALQIFEPSPQSTPERKLRLLHSIAVHAGRIPPTLTYALAQNNNHLLSEAAALVTAGLLLPSHPQSQDWRRRGWRLFNRGVQAQIDIDGAYGQHSANYQRLMLQLGLWIRSLSLRFGGGLELDSAARLAAATRWLLELLDPVSGHVPNLGANDGAYIFPPPVGSLEDYRPVLQAASRAFLGHSPLPHGDWDELCLWLCVESGVHPQAPSTPEVPLPHRRPHVLRHPDDDSWAYLRAAQFTGRPGHADQLHLDLWRGGENIAMDAGTYLYNAAPPWDNVLRHSEVHNTITIEGRDQMTSAGRFLYVDRAQANVGEHQLGSNGAWSILAANHNGYRRLGVRHTRRVECRPNAGWEIVDSIEPLNSQAAGRSLNPVLHWLLPDWPWEVDDDSSSWKIVLNNETAAGPVRLDLQAEGVIHTQQLQIIRAGKLLYGEGNPAPMWGWMSPTYAVKRPALAVRFSLSGLPGMRFISRFTFPKTQASRLG